MIEHLQHWRFEAREVQRDAWDEQAERNRDLEHESRETEEREASGYWDNADDERN
jgi:hypothetical protein